MPGLVCPSWTLSAAVCWNILGAFHLDCGITSKICCQR